MLGGLGARPRIEQLVDLRRRREVLIDEIEHELSEINSGGGRASQRGEVHAHVGGGAEVGDAAGGEDEVIVETLEDRRGRLVDRARDRHVLFGCDLFEEAHDLGRRGRVDARRRLVEEEDGGLLREGERDGEAPLEAARETAHELVARLRVLGLALEAELLEQRVDAGLARRAGDARAAECEGIAQVLTRRQRGPQRVLLLNVRAVLAVERAIHVCAVDHDAAVRLSALALKCEHVEQGGLARTRRSQDGEHMARRHRRGHVAEQDLVLGLDAPLERRRHRHRLALERDLHNVAAVLEVEREFGPGSHSAKRCRPGGRVTLGFRRSRRTSARTSLRFPRDSLYLSTRYSSPLLKHVWLWQF